MSFTSVLPATRTRPSIMRVHTAGQRSLSLLKLTPTATTAAANGLRRSLQESTNSLLPLRLVSTKVRSPPKAAGSNSKSSRIYFAPNALQRASDLAIPQTLLQFSMSATTLTAPSALKRSMERATSAMERLTAIAANAGSRRPSSRLRTSGSCVAPSSTELP